MFSLVFDLCARAAGAAGASEEAGRKRERRQRAVGRHRELCAVGRERAAEALPEKLEGRLAGHALGRGGAQGG